MGKVKGTVTLTATEVAMAKKLGISAVNFSKNPPERFLDPTLPLRLCLPLRVTLDLCLDMIIMNNYILNEDINI